MARIKITDSEDNDLYGTLPADWGTTPLAPYAALALATTMPERCIAVARLLGIPEEVFLSDAAHLLTVRRAAPWLLDGSLPDATDPVLEFAHAGTTYAHVGNLEKVSAEQLEALLVFLHEHEGKPLAAAPSLLAVLYCPKGQSQTADVVTATATAFETLPMSLAWPALAFFLRSSASRALRIQTALALETQARNLLQRLEEATQTAGASLTCWSNTRGWLMRQWLRHARKTLA